MIKIWRDDDPCVDTDPLLFREVHSHFTKYNKIHTCAVIMRDLWKNKELWYMLVEEPNIEICLHGLDHIDYGVQPYEKIVADIQESLEYWRVRVTRGFGEDKVKKILRMLPTWHSVSPELERACKDCGLELDARQSGEVYCFHYWEAIYPEKLKVLEDLLKANQ
jgi:hypothetical protein